jgi:hypothetical protein
MRIYENSLIDGTMEIDNNLLIANILSIFRRGVLN